MNEEEKRSTVKGRLSRGVRRKIVLAQLPPDGQAVFAHEIVEGCKKQRIDRKQVHDTLKEFIQEGLIFRDPDVIQGHSSVKYRRRLDYNSPMRADYLAAILDSSEREARAARRMNERRLAIYDARQQAILAWAQQWAIAQAVDAPTDEQAGVVVKLYWTDLLSPMLTNYVSTMRRSAHGKAFVQRAWGSLGGDSVADAVSE